MKKYIIILLLISSLLLTFNLSKEENTKEVNKVSKIDKVLEKPAGIQAYTINGEQTDLSYSEVLESYTLNSITCKNGTTATYNFMDNTVNLSNIKMPDYCVMDFKEGKILYNVILSDNSTKSTRTDFSSVFTSTTTGTLYKATEKNVHNTSDTTVYYYAGNTTNNWVYFAGYYWRIIRTNADGSIRLLYSGTSPSTTEGYIGESAFNSISDKSLYVGYKYGTTGSLSNNRTNTNDSSIKGVIDAWYKNNLTSYTSYLSTTAVYCSDRTVGSGTWVDSGSAFYYAPNTRIKTNKSPTYDCTESTDAFSSSNLSAKLTFPIALMTVDEISYAGGLYGSQNASVWYYLNSANGSTTGSAAWWLLSPSDYSDSVSWIHRIQGLNKPGYLYGSGAASDINGVRPVISLKGDLIYKSGNGTSSSPYQVQTNEHVLRLTKGTGVATIYYKINGASSYSSTTENNITIDTTNGSTYYYYGVSSTGYTMNSCTSSSPCSVTIDSNLVSKTLNATVNQYTLTLTRGTGVTTIYYKINGASSYSSTEEISIDLSVNYGSTYYYYGVVSNSSAYYLSCSSSSFCSGTMPASAASKTLNASKITYGVTINVNDKNYGSVSPSYVQVEAYGTSSAITITPTTGYKYSKVSCNYASYSVYNDKYLYIKSPSSYSAFCTVYFTSS